MKIILKYITNEDNPSKLRGFIRDLTKTIEGDSFQLTRVIAKQLISLAVTQLKLLKELEEEN